MNLRERSTQSELLDEPGISEADLWRNLYELDVINRYLGGHKNTIGALQKILDRNPDQTWRVIDLGCGGGDTLRAVNQHFGQKGVKLELTGVDILPEAISYAKKHTNDDSIKYWCADFASVGNDEYDIAISSLFCHHLYGDKFFEMLQTKRRLARYLVINDLHRHFLAYYSIKWLTRLFSKSYLVKHDAPLSVARGFKRQELELVLEKHEWSSLDIYWGWAFRWLVIAEKK